MLYLEEVDENIWSFNDESLTHDVDSLLDQAIDACNSGLYLVAEKSYLKIIFAHPTHVDAMHHLSLLYAETDRAEQSYFCALAAVSIGLQVLPAKFNWDTSKLPWGFLDNRPFLRAYHHVGLCYLQRREFSLANATFSKILSVNPDDNHGVRYVIPSSLFALNEPWAVAAHCKRFNEDASPYIQYFYALALILIDQVKLADKVLLKAVEDLPLVAKELLKKRHQRPRGSHMGYVSYGGVDQAFEYWRTYGKYWEASEVAMALLKNIYDG